MASKICRAISGRKPQRGLVQHQKARPAHQRAPDGQHLLLAAGQRAAALGEAFLQAREQREDAFQPRGAVGLAAVGGVGAHLQVLRHAHAREDSAAFRRLRDAQPRDLVGRHAGDVLAVIFDAAFLGAGSAEDRHHQRGFAGAIGPDQRDDLAGIDLDVDALERLDLAIGGARPRTARRGVAAAALTSRSPSRRWLPLRRRRDRRRSPWDRRAHALACLRRS